MKSINNNNGGSSGGEEKESRWFNDGHTRTAPLSPTYDHRCARALSVAAGTDGFRGKIRSSFVV